MTEASESSPIPEPRLQTPASEQQAPEISEKVEPSATTTNNQPQSRQSPENQVQSRVVCKGGTEKKWTALFKPLQFLH